MGVLTLTEGRVWGSSKSLLYEVLERVLRVARDDQQIERLELAILGNYGHYSLENANAEELKQFREVVNDLISDWQQKDDDTNPFLKGGIERLQELNINLSLLAK